MIPLFVSQTPHAGVQHHNTIRTQSDRCGFHYPTATLKSQPAVRIEVSRFGRRFCTRQKACELGLPTSSPAEGICLRDFMRSFTAVGCVCCAELCNRRASVRPADPGRCRLRRSRAPISGRRPSGVGASPISRYRTRTWVPSQSTIGIQLRLPPAMESRRPKPRLSRCPPNSSA